MLGWETVALLAVGLVVYVLARQKRLRIIGLLLLYIVVSVLLSLVMQLKEQRHVIGLIPVTAVVIGLLVDWDGLWHWLKKRPAGLGTAVIAALIFAWSLSPLNRPPLAEWQNPQQWWSPLFVGRLFHNDPYLAPLQEAGSYLKSHVPADAMLLVNRQGPVVGYYADRSYMILYTNTYAENLAYLEHNDYLVMDAMEFWQQSTAETEQLMQYVAENFVVETVFRGGGREIVLYRKGS